MTRNVLVVGRAFHPPWNEGTRVIGWNVARALSKSEHVHVVSLSGAAYTESSDTNVAFSTQHVSVSLPYGTLSDYRALPRLVQTLRTATASMRYDVAHLVGAPLIVAPLLQARGVSTYAHITLLHQAYLGRIDRIRAQLGPRLLSRWTDGFLPSSDRVAEGLHAAGVLRDKIHTVPPPIDTETYAPQRRSEARQRLGYRSGQTVVAYVGSVSPLRFPAQTVLAAIRRAARAVNDILLIAYVPVATHPYNTAWAERARRSVSNGEKIAVELRDLSSEDKRAVYSAADVVILPFQTAVAVEPPLTLLEAMSCGATVAVTPMANQSGIVENGVNGFVWTRPEDLVSVIERINPAAPPAPHQLTARATVLETFSFAAVSQRIRAVWDAAPTVR